MVKDLNETCRHAYDLLLTMFYLPHCNDARVIFITQNMNFNIHPPSTFIFFFGFSK
jgi:hypothetical protein